MMHQNVVLSLHIQCVCVSLCSFSIWTLGIPVFVLFVTLFFKIKAEMCHILPSLLRICTQKNPLFLVIFVYFSHIFSTWKISSKSHVTSHELDSNPQCYLYGVHVFNCRMTPMPYFDKACKQQLRLIIQYYTIFFIRCLMFRVFY